MELSLLTARRVWRYPHIHKSLSQCFSFQFVRCKQTLNVLENTTNEKGIIRSNRYSMLYVPGRLGGQIYQIVKPHIDANTIMKNIDHIKESCDFKGIDISFDNFIPLLREWDAKNSEYSEICVKNDEHKEELNRLKTLNLTDEHKAYMQEYMEFIEGLKAKKEELYDSEDAVYPFIERIPHVLNPSTPRQSDTIHLHINPPIINFEPLSHVEIGMKSSSLKLLPNSPTSYFLSGVFADLETSAQNYFYEKLKESEYHPLSCADFCKSFIVEAIGLDPLSLDDCIHIKSKNAREMGQKMNLVGGASFESFCAYLTNMNTNKETLPFRYLSMGRRYNAKYRHAKTLDLFSVVQSSNIHCFTLCKSVDEAEEFDRLFNLLVSFYQELKVPFRSVDVCARKLNAAESRRKQIEVWSPAQQKYVEVSNVSQHGDFVAKRLNITFGEQHVVEGHCCIVEGVAVNVPVLLGCIVENFQKSDGVFEFPEELKSLEKFCVE